MVVTSVSQMSFSTYHNGYVICKRTSLPSISQEMLSQTWNLSQMAHELKFLGLGKFLRTNAKNDCYCENCRIQAEFSQSNWSGFVFE